MNSKTHLLLFAAGLLAGAASLHGQAPYIITGADNGGNAVVNNYNVHGTFKDSLFGAPITFTGGVRVASGDVDGDGASDIITGEGVGGSTMRMYSGPSHASTYSVVPFGSSYGLGLYVAAGDINHDGRADLIAGGGSGGSPLVKVISGADGATAIGNFFAFSTGFTGGVRVASGDVNHDGFADIIAGTGAGAADIKVFSGKDLTVLASFSPFAAGYTGGVNVGSADVNKDGFADILVGTGGSAAGQMKVFSGKDLVVLDNFFPFGVGFNGEVRVGGADLNGDGFADLVAGSGPGWDVARERL